MKHHDTLLIIVSIILVVISFSTYMERINVGSKTKEAIQQDTTLCELKWGKKCSLQSVDINGIQVYTVEVDNDG